MSTKFNQSHVLTFTLSSLLGLAAAVGIGSTLPAAEAPSVTVSYRDLDLSRPADVQRLYHRLQEAASGVCMAPSVADLARRAAFNRCYQSVLESAVSEVHSPQLLALYQASQTGGA